MRCRMIDSTENPHSLKKYPTQPEGICLKLVWKWYKGLCDPKKIGRLIFKKSNVFSIAFWEIGWALCRLRVLTTMFLCLLLLENLSFMDSTWRFSLRLRTSDNGNRSSDRWKTIVAKTSMGSVHERFPREATSIEAWWLRLVDGTEPVRPFAGTFIMIVGALVTLAIYTQRQLLL